MLLDGAATKGLDDELDYRRTASKYNSQKQCIIWILLLFIYILHQIDSIHQTLGSISVDWDYKPGFLEPMLASSQP